MTRDGQGRPSDDAASNPTRRRALKLMALSVSSPLLAQVLSACGGSPSDPGGIETTDPTTPGPAPAPKPVKVLFVPGFMSELYTVVSEFEEKELNRALRQAARQHLDYEVTGLLGNTLFEINVGSRIAPLINVDLIPDGALVSFHTQVADFEDEGIDFHDITDEPGFDSAASVEHNAGAIAEYLAGVTDEVVVIVSHSKGGLDTLHALIGDPDLVGDTVVGWVALQAPFHGSPVAQLAPTALGDLIDTHLGVAVVDLHPDVREAYMSDNHAAIAEVGAAIPILSCFSAYNVPGGPSWASFAGTVFNGSLVNEIKDAIQANLATHLPDLETALDVSATAAVQLTRSKIEDTLSGVLANIGMMDTTNAAMNALGLPNDGLVPQESTQLPESTAIDLNAEVAAGDHASPVMITAPLKAFWTNGQRNAVTRDLMERVSPPLV